MRSKLLMCFMIFLLLLTGCTSDNQTEVGTNSGAYYKKVDAEIVEHKYNPLAGYAWSSLYYDGRIYTSYGSKAMLESAEKKEDLQLLEALGEELGTVYNNHTIYWSEDSEKLSEVTGEAKLYKVKGYDPEFCVCVCYEVGTQGVDKIYYAKIFEHLNDIYLDKGADLYTTRYNIDAATTVEIYGADFEYISTLNCSDSRITTLLTKAKETSFISASDDTLKLDYDAKLLFKYDNGMQVEALIYDEGYLAMKKYGEQYVLYIGEDICKSILE